MSPLPLLYSGLKKVDWSELYIKFIKDAQVPARCEGRDGGYDVNKYSEDGMKAFKKAIESGINYAVLVKSTMLYYKTHTKFALKLGNYIADGAWRTDYESLLSSATEGKIEDHIQKEINDNKEFNRFKIG